MKEPPVTIGCVVPRADGPGKVYGIYTMFISWLGTVALSAQALSIPVFYVALSLGKGVQVGTATLISRTRGENHLSIGRLITGISTL